MAEDGVANSSGVVDVSVLIRQRLGRKTQQIQAPLGNRVETGLRILDDLSPAATVRGGSLIEIVGTTHSGKTRLLHLLAAQTLLRSCTVESGVSHNKARPSSTTRSHRNNTDATINAAVVKPVLCWYDLNGGLDIVFLYRLLHSHTRCATRSRQLLNRMNVYNIDTALQLCKSLHDLCDHMRTTTTSVTSSRVACVIIDALGSTYYRDKYDSDARMRRNELPIDMTLAHSMARLLAITTTTTTMSPTVGQSQKRNYCNKVVVFCSKCGLFDSHKVDVVKWPFQRAGIPEMPGEFMPDAWKRLVSHVIVLYHIDDEGGTDDNNKTQNVGGDGGDGDGDGDGGQRGGGCRRGALCVYYAATGSGSGGGKNSGQRRLYVGGASVLRIASDDVGLDDAQTVIV